MAQIHLPATKRAKPWGITLVSLLAIGGLISMPFLAGPAGDSDKLPDMVRFLGHFHPVLLHLPIGVFALIMIQELAAIFAKRGSAPRQVSLYPMFFGATSAIVAVIAGFLLYQGHGDDYGGSELAERHLWGGLVFAVAAVVTYLVQAWTVASGGNLAFYRLLLFGSVGIMGFASHDGASLTHGEDYLTVYAPDPIRKAMGLEVKTPKKVKTPATDSKPPVVAGTTPDGTPAPVPTGVPATPPAGTVPAASVYSEVVHPILERRCVQCHKEGKAKGKYRMDTFEALVKGGKEGPGLVPGKATESSIVIRMELPKDDEEHMPPEGKPDIEDHELAVVKWWIDAGADQQKPLSAFDLPGPIKDAIAKIAPGGAPAKGTPSPADATGADENAASPHEVTEAPVVPADEGTKNAVAELSKEFPGALSFEARDSPLLVFTAVSLRGNLDDAGFKKLEALTPSFVSVDLSATKITDQAVAQLATSKNLKLVRLAETEVTDTAIDTLAKLTALESINLYGTKVTDAGVKKLAALPALKRLYLWKTAVTPEALRFLQEKMPKCEIVTGAQS